MAVTGMKQDWQLDTSKGRCTITNRQLAEGEEFHSVLFEDHSVEGGFRRVDYSLEAWQGVPEGAFCSFKTHVPVREKRRRLLVDNEILVNFFLRLADETQPLRVQFRFVLALILMRKRILRYDGCASIEGVETWQMTLPADQSEHRVINPKLTEEQIEGVSGQLGAILHGDAGQWSQADVEEPSISIPDGGVSDDATG
jgi:hypothetical protein